jgi:hypothetical protein
MSIKIKSKTVVGFRFSDICFFDVAGGYEFLTETIESEVAKKFEDSIIDHEEVNPELIALIFDLDYFEYNRLDSDDAIIGVEINKTDIGSKNVSMMTLKDFEMNVRKIKACIKGVDPDIVEKVRLEIATISSLKESD